MNWFKAAVIDNFKDRNVVNEKIRDLDDITVALTRLSKLVFQTGSNSRNMLRNILASKRLTSYPPIQKLLETADEICLDSPHRFSAICKAAAQQVEIKMRKLKVERREFTHKNARDKWKGWRAND